MSIVLCFYVQHCNFVQEVSFLCYYICDMYHSVEMYRCELIHNDIPFVRIALLCATTAPDLICLFLVVYVC